MPTSGGVRPPLQAKGSLWDQVNILPPKLLGGGGVGKDVNLVQKSWDSANQSRAIYMQRLANLILNKLRMEDLNLVYLGGGC